MTLTQISKNLISKKICSEVMNDLRCKSEHFWGPEWLTDLSPKEPAEEAAPGWGRGEFLDQIGRGVPVLTEHI